MPQIDIPFEALDAIVIGALKDHIECLEINQKTLQDIIDAGGDLEDYQKVDYYDNADMMRAMNKIIDYFGG